MKKFKVLIEGIVIVALLMLNFILLVSIVKGYGDVGLGEIIVSSFVVFVGFWFSMAGAFSLIDRVLYEK